MNSKTKKLILQTKRNPNIVLEIPSDLNTTSDEIYVFVCRNRSCRNRGNAVFCAKLVDLATSFPPCAFCKKVLNLHSTVPNCLEANKPLENPTIH